jgi:hypothetical protein
LSTSAFKVFKGPINDLNAPEEGEKSGYSPEASPYEGHLVLLVRPTPPAGIVYDVERLYCKRPILCRASSKILTPHPLTARRVCTPPRLWCGGRTHSLGEKGEGGQGGRTHSPGGEGKGGQYLEDARHSSVLYTKVLRGLWVHYHCSLSHSRFTTINNCN